jgi:hypothetical protein
MRERGDRKRLTSPISTRSVRGSEGLDASETAECFYSLSIMGESCIAFQLCVEGRLFCLKILEML